MPDKGEMMTSEELVAGVENWLHEREMELATMVRQGESGTEGMTEIIAFCGSILDLFQMCKFAPTQELCVMVLQAMILGPDHVHKLVEIVNGLNSGAYVLLPTRNVAALIGPPAGRA